MYTIYKQLLTSGLACWLITAFSFNAVAHHSAHISYDMTEVHEIEGEVSRVIWRNPHVRFKLIVPNSDGEKEVWTVESIPVTRLTRVGITQDLLNVGDKVKVAGFYARRPVKEMYATNLLLADRREALLDSPAPRWTRNTLGTGTDSTSDESSADSTLGIFRVWSNDGTFLETETRFLMEGGTLNYPLTEAGKAAQSKWDPLTEDNPFITCTPKGMPIIMQQPNPIEFVDEGERILLKIEEFDTLRVISMMDSGDEPIQAEQASVLGRSSGHWEGNTLVVATDNIGWQYFDQTAGLKQSKAVKTLEKFTVNKEGSRLDYELIVTDPWLFTEPVHLSKSWRWVPGEKVLPYNCTD